MKTLRVSKPTNNPKVPGSGLHSFRCADSRCQKLHRIGIYVVAQCAMGHVLTHTCDCGQKHAIENSGRSYRVTTTTQPAPAAELGKDQQ